MLQTQIKRYPNAAFVADAMKMAGLDYLKQIPVEVEVTIRNNWQEK
jgi:hypothetical protein